LQGVKNKRSVTFHLTIPLTVGVVIDNVHCNVVTDRMMPIRLNRIIKYHGVGDALASSCPNVKLHADIAYITIAHGVSGCILNNKNILFSISMEMDQLYQVRVCERDDDGVIVVFKHDLAASAKRLLLRLGSDDVLSPGVWTDHTEILSAIAPAPVHVETLG
jgi:hypothetical protein